MHRSMAWIAASLVFVAGALSAQEERRFRLFAGLEPGASYSDIDGLDLQTAYVLGFDAYVAPRWAAEVAASYQRESYAGGFAGFTAETTSLDTALRRDLLHRGRWTLQGLTGVRYSRLEDARGFIGVGGLPGTSRQTEDRVGLLLGLGAEYRFSNRFALRLSAKQVPWTFSGDERFFEDTALGTALAFEF